MDNLKFQNMEEIIKVAAILDLILTKKEELLKNLKQKGNLGECDKK